MVLLNERSIVLVNVTLCFNFVFLGFFLIKIIFVFCLGDVFNIFVSILCNVYVVNVLIEFILFSIFIIVIGKFFNSKIL